jgi:hypothetical protein
MNKSKEKLLAEIDTTLDLLIKNTEALEGVSFRVLEKNELTGLQKVHESICAHLLHREHMLKEALQENIGRFTLLNERLMREMKKRFLAKNSKKNRRRRLKA